MERRPRFLNALFPPHHRPHEAEVQEVSSTETCPAVVGEDEVGHGQAGWLLAHDGLLGLGTPLSGEGEHD